MCAFVACLRPLACIFLPVWTGIFFCAALIFSNRACISFCFLFKIKTPFLYFRIHKNREKEFKTRPKRPLFLKVYFYKSWMRKNICGLSCSTAFTVFSIFMTYNFNRPYLAYIIKISLPKQKNTVKKKTWQLIVLIIYFYFLR